MQKDKARPVSYFRETFDSLGIEPKPQDLFAGLGLRGKATVMYVTPVGRAYVKLGDHLMELLSDETPVFGGPAEVEEFVQFLAAAAKTNVNAESPLMAATLPGGYRCSVVGPAVTGDGYSIVLMRAASVPEATLAELAERGSMSSDMARFLEYAMDLRAGILIVGPTSSGKTTLLSALYGRIGHQTVNPLAAVIEDVPEIHANRRAAERFLKTRMDTGLHHKGVDAATLVSFALCTPLDVLVLGDTRDAAAYSLMLAAGTECQALTCVLGTSVQSGLRNMVSMARQSETQPEVEAVREGMAELFDLVVTVGRDEQGCYLVKGVDQVLGWDAKAKEFRLSNAFKARQDDEGNPSFIKDPDMILSDRLHARRKALGLGELAWHSATTEPADATGLQTLLAEDFTPEAAGMLVVLVRATCEHLGGSLPGFDGYVSGARSWLIERDVPEEATATEMKLLLAEFLLREKTRRNLVHPANRRELLAYAAETYRAIFPL